MKEDGKGKQKMSKHCYLGEKWKGEMDLKMARRWLVDNNRVWNLILNLSFILCSVSFSCFNNKLIMYELDWLNGHKKARLDCFEGRSI